MNKEVGRRICVDSCMGPRWQPSDCSSFYVQPPGRAIILDKNDSNRLSQTDEGTGAMTHKWLNDQYSVVSYFNPIPIHILFETVWKKVFLYVTNVRGGGCGSTLFKSIAFVTTEERFGVQISSRVTDCMWHLFAKPAVGGLLWVLLPPLSPLTVWNLL